VILDIYSWYVVGSMIAHRESTALAEVLIRQTCIKQSIGRDQLQRSHGELPVIDFDCAPPGGVHYHPRRPRQLDDLQTGRVPARRPGHHPVAQPPARRRQPLQRRPALRLNGDS
jgi:hypothetical protein